MFSCKESDPEIVFTPNLYLLRGNELEFLRDLNAVCLENPDLPVNYLKKEFSYDENRLQIVQEA